MLEAYRQHVKERAAQGIPPLPLNAEQVAGLVELLKNPPAGEQGYLLDLITNRVPPGVDEAAYVKAGFLSAVARGETQCPLIDRVAAVKLLGNMHGGYNIETLVGLLTDAELGAQAAEELKHTLLMFDAFHDVAELADGGNANAKSVMQSWADAEWFTSRDEVPESIKVAVFKVTGETNTDDLSPAPDAWSRPDIPLHALAMLKNARDGIEPDEPGKIVGARRGSPLVVGVGEGFNVLASDVAAILGHTKQVIYLDDWDRAVLTPDGVQTTDIDAQTIDKEIWKNTV